MRIPKHGVGLRRTRRSSPGDTLLEKKKEETTCMPDIMLSTIAHVKLMRSMCPPSLSPPAPLCTEDGPPEKPPPRTTGLAWGNPRHFSLGAPFLGVLESLDPQGPIRFHLHVW